MTSQLQSANHDLNTQFPTYCMQTAVYLKFSTVLRWLTVEQEILPFSTVFLKSYMDPSKSGLPLERKNLWKNPESNRDIRIFLDLSENHPNDTIHAMYHHDHPGPSNVGWTRSNVSIKDTQGTAGVSRACRKLRETNADAS